MKLHSLLLLVLLPPFALANWWDFSWHYNVPITINNSGSALSDYQLNIAMDTASLVSAGKMRPDCWDLRFVNSSGAALQYWLESGCNTAGTRIWVNVPYVPNGASTIYAFYGNPNASAAGSFDGTFTKNYGESGLAGLWHMDDGGGTTTADSSGNGNMGNLINGPVWQPGDGGQWDGRSDAVFGTGSSLRFNGVNNYVQALNIGGLSGSREATFEYWVKFDAFGAYDLSGYIDGAHNSIRLGVYNGNQIYMNAGYHADVGVGYTFQTGRWYHLALTMKVGDRWRVYVNGQLVTDGTAGLPSSSFSAIPYFGIGGALEFSSTGLAHPTAGIIDEARLYSRALGAVEIYRHYVRSKYAATEPTTLAGAEQRAGYRTLVRRCGLKQPGINVTAYALGSVSGSCVSDPNGICFLEINPGSYDLQFRFADSSTAWKNGTVFG